MTVDRERALSEAALAESMLDPLFLTRIREEALERRLQTEFLASLPGHCPACGSLGCEFDCCYEVANQ